MKKILLSFVVVAILLFSNINGMNEKGSRKTASDFFSQGMNERVTNKIFNKNIPFNFHNIFSFILSILFPNLEKILWRNSSPSSLNDEIDQSQEKSDNYYKIYGSNWFAQSFKNTKGKLTKVEILISKHTKRLNLLSNIKFVKNSKIGNLTVAII